MRILILFFIIIIIQRVFFNFSQISDFDSKKGTQISVDQIRLLSFGTFVSPPQSLQLSPNWGTIQWAASLPSFLEDSNIKQIQTGCQSLLGSNYTRINIPLPHWIPIDGFVTPKILFRFLNFF